MNFGSVDVGAGWTGLGRLVIDRSNQRYIAVDVGSRTEGISAALKAKVPSAQPG